MKKDNSPERGVFYTHGKDANDKRFTLAAKKVTENQVHIGLAICNPKDNFCRKTGRNIAKLRTTGRPIQTVSVEGTEEEQRNTVAQAMYELKERVQKNADAFMIRNLTA